MTFCIYGDLFIPEWKTHFINGGLTVSAYLTSVFLMVFGFIELVFLIAAGLAISLTSGQAVVKERNIPAAVALSVLTFGIFFIYWIYQMIQSIMLAKGDKKGNSAGELLCFLFLPFYSLYWYYTRAKKIYAAQKERNIVSRNQCIFCIVFYIIGLQAISLMLLQKELNKIARKDRLLQQQRTGYYSVNIEIRRGTMYCSQCGNEVSGGGKFCPACGHNIQETGIKADRNIEIKSIKKGKYIDGSVSNCKPFGRFIGLDILLLVADFCLFAWLYHTPMVRLGDSNIKVMTVFAYLLLICGCIGLFTSILGYRRIRGLYMELYENRIVGIGTVKEMSYSQVSFDLPYSAVELTAIQGSVILLTSKGVTCRIAVESFSKASDLKYCIDSRIHAGSNEDFSKKAETDE